MEIQAPLVQEGESFDNYYSRYGQAVYGNNWINTMRPYGILGKLENKVTGLTDSALKEYERQYNEANLAKQQKYEFEYQRALRSTQYQDLIKDMRAAGINPYAIMNGAGFNPGGAVSTTTSANKLSKKDDNESSQRGLAAFIFLLGTLAKIFL